jgi:predicted nuclease of predicted toxin-antitoxin system
VKLLFDHNLSPRLALRLSDLFSASIHVSDVQLQEADDLVVWNYAKVNGLVIVTKDSDFSDRSLLMGHPPKIIRIHLGNCATSAVEALLRSHQQTIAAFEDDAEKSCLHLPPAGWLH